MKRQEIILGYIWSNFWLRYHPVDFKIDIKYGSDDNGKINIRHCGYQFNENDRKITKEDFAFIEWDREKLPFLGSIHPAEIITFNEGSCTINFDIIAPAFYFLSGWQELYAEKRDQFDRFTFKGSIQDELKAWDVPFVNYYFQILQTAIERVYNVQLKLRKRDSGMYVLLSHDIDELSTLWLQEGFHALKKGKLHSLPGLALRHWAGKDYSDSINSVIEMNSRGSERPVNSTFFFLCSNQKEGIYKNADYDINDVKVKEEIHTILNAGNEAGIHGSFHTHNSTENLNKDIKTLEGISGSKVKGNRFHFLSYSKETPSVLEKCGMNYDSTLGFAECIGFRNSYADPFYLFDHVKFVPTSVIEFPLAIMDASLYFRQYMNYDYANSLHAVKDLIKKVYVANGTLVINWHNTGYLQHKNNWLTKLLQDIISVCEGYDARFLTMSEYYSELKGNS